MEDGWPLLGSLSISSSLCKAGKCLLSGRFQIRVGVGWGWGTTRGWGPSLSQLALICSPLSVGPFPGFIPESVCSLHVLMGLLPLHLLWFLPHQVGLSSWRRMTWGGGGGECHLSLRFVVEEKCTESEGHDLGEIQAIPGPSRHEKPGEDSPRRMGF